MITFIIGIVGLTVMSIISMFVPSFYSYYWGYANIEGVIGDAAVSQSGKIYYSLAEGLAPWAYVFLGLMIFCFAVYTFALLVKKSNIGGLLPLIRIVAIMPIVAMVICAIKSYIPGEYVKVGNVVIGAGQDAGITIWCVICFVLLIGFYCVFAKGVTLIREKIAKEEKGPQQVKVKVEKKANYEDFKL